MASSFNRPSIPSFKKGDFVVPVIVPFRGGVKGCRRMTAEENQAWNDDPDNQGIGDDGESKIHSGTFYRDLPEGTQLIVTRARVQARQGWSTVGGLAEVKVIATNEILTVDRRSLKLGQ